MLPGVPCDAYRRGACQTLQKGCVRGHPQFLPEYQSACQPAFLSAYLSACLPACLSICLCVCLTCLGINGEEVLRVAGSDAVTKSSGYGAGVWVLSLNTYDGNILGRVLHDDWVVDRVRGQRGVVIDILYLKVESMHMSQREKAD